MVTSQIVARGVADPRVLAAMREVPRHRFLPEAMARDAYEDRPLPIGEGQTISQPYMVAAMTAALAPGPTDHVLEVGTGSGYQAAILARLAGSVVSIERHPALAERAAATMDALGISNVRVVVGDGSTGYAAEAPYDRILVTAGAPAIPESLKAQLADGGRLVIPVGPEGLQHVLVVERRGPLFSTTEGEGCVFVPLIGQHGWPR
jgi:protein-L-isoaspartate(D-aspartate) O-methyltransferase